MTVIPWLSVADEAIGEVAHDPSRRAIFVRSKSGETRWYANCSRALFEELVASRAASTFVKQRLSLRPSGVLSRPLAALDAQPDPPQRPLVHDVAGWLASLPEDKRALADAVRAFIAAAVPEVVEEYQWGSVMYLCATRVFYLDRHPDGVRIAFFRSSTLHDPADKLRGTPPIRQTPIAGVQDLDEDLAALLRDAVAKA